LHGDVPNFENFIRFVFEGARATCLIEDTGGSPLGLVQAWRVDTMSEHCQVTAFLAPEAEGRAWPLEGILLFVDYAFRAFALNKIYVETLETELNSYRSVVGTVLEQEGHFRQHKKLFGRWVDGYMFAIYRPAFDAFYARTVGRARPAPGPAPMRDGDDAVVAG
jgi:RimJ/RimL family protein N-acetyltransferase